MSKRYTITVELPDTTPSASIYNTVRDLLGGAVLAIQYDNGVTDAPEWAPTHYSTLDGSQVRLLNTNGHRNQWENENGETWWEDSAYWRPIIEPRWDRSMIAEARDTGRLSDSDPGEQSIPRADTSFLHRIDPPPTPERTKVYVHANPDGTYTVWSKDDQELAVWDDERTAIDWCRDMDYQPRPRLSKVATGILIQRDGTTDARFQYDEDIDLVHDEYTGIDLVHKATPLVDHTGATVAICHHCLEAIKVVPGGHGPTWVHSETGAVAASGGPR